MARSRVAVQPGSALRSSFLQASVASNFCSFIARPFFKFLCLIATSVGRSTRCAFNARDGALRSSFLSFCFSITTSWVFVRLSVLHCFHSQRSSVGRYISSAAQKQQLLSGQANLTDKSKARLCLFRFQSVLQKCRKHKHQNVAFRDTASQPCARLRLALCHVPNMGRVHGRSDAAGSCSARNEMKLVYCMDWMYADVWDGCGCIRSETEWRSLKGSRNKG